MKRFRVVVTNASEGYHCLVYSGQDEDEAIECYEECRLDTLLGENISDVIFYNGKGEQLARTYAEWHEKIIPMIS